jgi:hypothetical protein
MISAMQALLPLRRALSKWVLGRPPDMPKGYPSQAEIEANTSGYTPGGWDVTANDPRRKPKAGGETKPSNRYQDVGRQRLAGWLYAVAAVGWAVSAVVWFSWVSVVLAVVFAGASAATFRKVSQLKRRA